MNLFWVDGLGLVLHEHQLRALGDVLPRDRVWCARCLARKAMRRGLAEREAARARGVPSLLERFIPLWEDAVEAGYKR